MKAAFRYDRDVHVYMIGNEPTIRQSWTHQSNFHNKRESLCMGQRLCEKGNRALAHVHKSFARHPSSLALA
ncbi:MAG: hypothetical protein OJF47_001130 [Nitrospira sp.]|jgi:hypothetical protein|nr:MAG: hypothetical protein OJF47_001130 [Nitrospira sp.]